jgi:2-dehydro-3-deoxygluconokinase
MERFHLNPERPVVLTVGEVMLRLAAPGRSQLESARSFDASWGGSEANVAVALARWGERARLLTAVPNNTLGASLHGELRRYGVDTSAVLGAPGRMGLYFVEHGAGPRPSTVLYDRADSAFSGLDAEHVDIDATLDGVGWLHWSGITPALGAGPRRLLQRLIDASATSGIVLSCDLNYRAKLWSSEEAVATLTPLMKNVDLCIGNEEDAHRALGLPSENPSDFARTAETMRERFGFRAAALSVRHSHSASRNSWAAVLATPDGVAQTAPREVDGIVDRFGAGDAFTAGLIRALRAGMPAQRALEFAEAAGAMKHTMPGDFLLSTYEQVMTLANGDGTGRVQR